MDDPEQYQSCNVIQKRDALLCLEEFGAIIKWKNCGERIIDIGCGDGGITTSILKNYIPPNYKKIVGCDISEEMVEYANKNHSSDNIKFITLNIEGKLPYILRSSFDHAFSLYALHWIENQEAAFRNIYDLLAEGGSCWLMFFGYMPFYDVYRLLARTERWRYWLKDFERYMPPYQDSQDPEKEVTQMMEKIGFTNIEVNVKRSSFVYQCIEIFKKTVTTVNPFKIPKDIFNSYLEDFISMLYDMGCIDQADNGQINVTFHYSLLIISGNKSGCTCSSKVNDGRKDSLS